MEIAFFDFDGTITTKDTLLQVIKYQKGNAAFFAGFLINLPFLAAFKLKLITNQKAKEIILKHFFGGTDIAAFQDACDTFAINVLPNFVRPGAIAEIKKLQAQGFEVVVVSASAENWIKKWSDGIGVKLIASQLEVVNNQLTGKIKKLNCNGVEKVRRIKSAYDLSLYDGIYAYGDSNGDKPMLALANKAFYKPFR
jgi:phosphatidylglycerophosphatase C